MTKVFIVRFDFNEEKGTNKWDLVTSELKAAAIDSGYELASREDLFDYISANGFIFDGLIQTKDGVCQYYETYDEDGDIQEFGYGLVKELAIA